MTFALITPSFTVGQLTMRPKPSIVMPEPNVNEPEPERLRSLVPLVVWGSDVLAFRRIVPVPLIGVGSPSARRRVPLNVALVFTVISAFAASVIPLPVTASVAPGFTCNSRETATPSSVTVLFAPVSPEPPPRLPTVPPLMRVPVSSTNEPLPASVRAAPFWFTVVLDRSRVPPLLDAYRLLF